MKRTAVILTLLAFVGGAWLIASCGGGGGGSSDVGRLVVELTWSTPSDPDETDTYGTDFDLHVRDEGATWWFDDTTGPGSDCYSGNTNPDWGVAGDASDDPVLEIEDNDGAGPEIISIDSPSVGMTYTVGVHSSLDNGFESSFVSIKVYVNDNLDYQLLDEEMVQGWVWEAVEIGWTESGPVFKTIDVQESD